MDRYEEAAQTYIDLKLPDRDKNDARWFIMLGHFTELVHYYHDHHLQPAIDAAVKEAMEKREQETCEWERIPRGQRDSGWLIAMCNQRRHPTLENFCPHCGRRIVEKGGVMFFKVLGKDGAPCNGGSGKWGLPSKGADGKWIPGEWMPAIEGKLVPCERGYHLCREKDLLTWLNNSIYEAEYRGEMVEGEDKIVCREVRLLRRMNWDERVARLFACWCAEQVLPIFEKERPDDNRPRKAIEVARLFADGKATKEELAAAWAAAWAAAGDAAGAAAGYAAGSAARAAARYAAWAAARYAAWAAAWAAAWYAAWAAAWAAQTKKLLEMIEEA